MSNPLRIRRRTSGAAGAPSSLLNAELAFNEVDNTLYYGYGDVAGSASSILAIGGPGAFATLTSCQTISGDKTFTGNLNAITQANTTNSNLVATTAFVTNKLTNLTNVVNMFNNRTGNVTLTSNDVTTALGYSPLTPLANITHANGTIITGTYRVRGEVQVYTDGLYTKKQYGGFFSTANGAEPTSYQIGLACITTSTGVLHDEHYLEVSDAGVFLGSADRIVNSVSQLYAQRDNIAVTFTPGDDYALQQGQLRMYSSGADLLAGNSTTVSLTSALDSDAVGINLTNNGTHALALLTVPTGCLTLLYEANSILTQGYADSRYVPSSTADVGVTIAVDIAGAEAANLTIAGEALTYTKSSGSLTFNPSVGLTYTRSEGLVSPTNAGDFIYKSYADTTYVRFSSSDPIAITSASGGQAQLYLEQSGFACLTATSGSTPVELKVDAETIGGSATLTGVGSWSNDSILIRDYADARYAPAATNLQFLRGTAVEVDATVPLIGEPVYVTDLYELRIGDGITSGGRPVLDLTVIDGGTANG